MIASEILDHERKQFFINTHGSVYLPLIGIVFWPFLGVAGFFLSPQSVCLAVFFSIVVLIPVALIVGKWLSKKLLLKSPLASLMLPALVPVLMSFGITIPLYFTNIALVPLAFVLGLSLHWPAFGWLYDQRGFSIHCLARTVLAVSLWYFYPTQLFTLLPISIGFLYLLTACWLLVKLHQAKKTANSIS